MGAPVDEVQAAATRYYTDLPYHDWTHVQEVVDAAEHLLARCWQYDVDVDDDTVRCAIYFHDAGYQWEHEAVGYDSKEAYSAAIAGDVLDTLDMDDDRIETVQDCIMATHPDATYDTTEQKVVRAADLSGLMADYDTFRDNALQLRDEHRHLHGPIDDADWVDQVRDTLEHYLQQDIRITPEHDDEHGLSTFHANAGRNLGLFLQEFG